MLERVLYTRTLITVWTMFVILQEFRQWGADLNSVIYQGEKESRTMIRDYEFYKGKTPLFDALVTSYDLAMLDNTILQKFDWACIIGLSLSFSYIYQV